MRICDECKSLTAKTLFVRGKIDPVPLFEGSEGDFAIDLCRDCFDRLRRLLGLLKEEESQ